MIYTTISIQDRTFPVQCALFRAPRSSFISSREPKALTTGVMMDIAPMHFSISTSLHYAVAVATGPLRIPLQAKINTI